MCMGRGLEGQEGLHSSRLEECLSAAIKSRFNGMSSGSYRLFPKERRIHLKTGSFPLSWEKAEVLLLVLEELMPKGMSSWFPWCAELWHSLAAQPTEQIPAQGRQSPAGYL